MRPLRIRVVALAALSGCAAVLAAAGPTTVDRDVTASSVNGMKVVVKRVPGAEFVAGHLSLKGGALNWGKADAGVENLALATAASGGTQKLDKGAFARRMAAMGSSITAESGNGSSVIRAKSLKRHWSETADLLADVFLRPALPAFEIELQRQLMLSTLKTELENPDSELRLMVHRVLFAGHPFENRAAGTPESVAALTREQLEKHLAKLRATSRMLLVVVGDVAPADVFAWAGRAFGALPRGSEAPALPPRPRFTKPDVKIEPRKLPTNYVASVFPAPEYVDRDFAAAAVSMSLLGQREFEEVRTKRNLSYAPAAFLDRGRLPYGTIYVTATDPATTMEVMYGEARRLQNEAVPEKELAGTKETFLTQFLMSSETTDGQADLLAQAELNAGDWREAMRLPDRVRAVTPADVQAFAKKYIRDLQTVMIGDPSKYTKGLALAF